MVYETISSFIRVNVGDERKKIVYNWRQIGIKTFWQLRRLRSDVDELYFVYVYMSSVGLRMDWYWDGTDDDLVHFEWIVLRFGELNRFGSFVYVYPSQAFFQIQITLFTSILFCLSKVNSELEAFQTGSKAKVF